MQKKNNLKAMNFHLVFKNWNISQSKDPEMIFHIDEMILFLSSRW